MEKSPEERLLMLTQCLQKFAEKQMNIINGESMLLDMDKNELKRPPQNMQDFIGKGEILRDVTFKRGILEGKAQILNDLFKDIETATQELRDGE